MLASNGYKRVHKRCKVLSHIGVSRKCHHSTITIIIHVVFSFVYINFEIKVGLNNSCTKRKGNSGKQSGCSQIMLWKSPLFTFKNN